MRTLALAHQLPVDKDLAKAKKQAGELQKDARNWIKIMSAEVAEFSALAGMAVGEVSVGDAGTRWGSCSSTGRIRLSWRLILAPPEVRRYVVAHEVAHLKHLDHGAKFKALEAELFGPGLSEAKAILRRIGPRLRRIGRPV